LLNPHAHLLVLDGVYHNDGTRAVFAECTAPDGCPEGYGCFDVAEGAQIVGRQCMPKTYTCP